MSGTPGRLWFIHERVHRTDFSPEYLFLEVERLVVLLVELKNLILSPLLGRLVLLQLFQKGAIIEVALEDVRLTSNVVDIWRVLRLLAVK